MSGGRLENGIIQHAGANTYGWVSNLGITITSGLLKITQADQTDINPDRPAYVTLDSTTAGKLYVLKIDGSTVHEIQDASGASDIIGEEFGTTASVAWGDSRRAFLGICNPSDNNTDPFFFLTHDIKMKVTPSSSTNIGYKGTPMSSPSDNGITALTSTDVTSFTSKPCFIVGSVSWTKDGSDDWTFDALSNSTGIGKFQEEVVSQMSVGQKGNASGKYFEDNGGTAPGSFGDESFSYTLGKDGYVDCNVFFASATVGSGAVALIMNMPYDVVDSSGAGSTFTNYTGALRHRRSSGTDKVSITIDVQSSSSSALFYDTALDAFLLIDDLTSGSDDENLVGSFRYKAF